MHRLTAPVPFISSEPKTLPTAFYERLIRFYAEQPAVDEIISPIWEGAQPFTLDLHEALKSEDPQAVEADLSILYDGMRVFGLDWGHTMIDSERIAACQDQFERNLMACAYSAGLYRFYNPEQPDDEPVDPEPLIAGIEGLLGCRLSHPGGGKIFGALIGNRLVPLKFLPTACTLLGMHRLSVWPPKKVLELGAGAGFLCYLMQRSIGPVEYHVIDLPIISVIFAYLFACAGYADCLYLSRERYQPGQHLFLHGLHHEDAGAVEYDLFINQDSLPEIPVDVAHRYLETAIGSLRPSGVFHSVNHESPHGGQVPVRELMNGYPEMEQRVRAPFFGRAGWLEEVWVKS